MRWAILMSKVHKNSPPKIILGACSGVHTWSLAIPCQACIFENATVFSAVHYAHDYFYCNYACDCFCYTWFLRAYQVPPYKPPPFPKILNISHLKDCWRMKHEQYIEACTVKWGDFDKRGDFDNSCYFTNTNTLPSYSSIFRLTSLISMEKAHKKMFYGSCYSTDGVCIFTKLYFPIDLYK